MSKFYGQVEGQASTVASRRGSANSGLKVSAQSWEGSVIVRLWENKEGETMVEIEKGEGSTSWGGDTIYRGKLEDLKPIKQS